MHTLDPEQLAALTTIPKVKRKSMTAMPEQSASYDAGEAQGGPASLDLSCWNPHLQSEDLSIQEAGDSVQARVIDLVHNDGMMSGAAVRIDNETVGTGLKLSMSVDWDAMGITKEQGQALNALIEREWRTWTRSSRNSVDITRKVNWPAMQTQASRSNTYKGEILAAFEPRRSPMRGERQTAIRLLDPSRLSDPADNPTAIRDRDIRQGVEYDSNGAPVAYWISSRQKSEVTKRGRVEKLKWRRYEKYGRDGRIKIFHAFDPTRAEQSRGISPLAATVRAAKMLDKLNDATLQAALLQTLFALVVKSEANWKDIIEVLGTGDKKSEGGISLIKEYMNSRADFYRANPPKIGGQTGARAVHLLPDETLELTAAKANNPDAARFITEMSSEVARGSGMSLESFTGNYERTNYSSSRMGNAESHKVTAGKRARLIDPFMSWVLEHFVEELFIRKPNELPSGVSFYEHRDSLTSCTWIGSPPVDPDPYKTAQAAEKRLSGGYSTLKYESSLLGLDWQEVLEQQAAEAEMRKSLGLLDAMKEEVDAQQPTPEPQETGSTNGDD